MNRRSRSVKTNHANRSERAHSALLRPTDRPGGMRRWRKQLYVALARNASSPADYFHLPADRTVTVGSAIDI